MYIWSLSQILAQSSQNLWNNLADESAKMSAKMSFIKLMRLLWDCI